MTRKGASHQFCLIHVSRNARMPVARRTMGGITNLSYGSFSLDAPEISDETSSFPRLWIGPQRVFHLTKMEKSHGALKGEDPNTAFIFPRIGRQSHLD